MSLKVARTLDFDNATRIENLPAATATGHPVTYEQFLAGLEGTAWKDNVRVAAQVNVNLAAPGASIDGIAMAANDRFLAPAQTSQPENGIYIWNGAATPATRAPDASTFDELESAVVAVDEGTNAGTKWRQTQVNGVIGTNNIIWTADGSAAPAASETTAGVSEYATQAETDAGTADDKTITPFKLANYSGRAKRFSATIGDGAATSIVVTHNLNTEDVQVYVREVGGSKRAVIAEVQHTSVNSVTVLFDVAPANNSLRVTVQA